jgi:hypothetical protein
MQIKMQGLSIKAEKRTALRGPHNPPAHHLPKTEEKKASASQNWKRKNQEKETLEGDAELPFVQCRPGFQRMHRDV